MQAIRGGSFSKFTGYQRWTFSYIYMVSEVDIFPYLQPYRVPVSVPHPPLPVLCTVKLGKKNQFQQFI